MVKKNSYFDKDTAQTIKNVKDTKIPPNLENENLMHNTHIPKFIKDKVDKNQKIYEENQIKNAQNAKFGGAGGPKHLWSNDPNSYKPAESFSDYFNTSSKEFKLKGGETPIKPVNLNVPEMYKGFIRFNSYAWGIAATIGIIGYLGYKAVNKAHDLASSQKQKQTE
ncbi:hypothetical protein RB653_009054 [Dictyostelium firmibasis]|uniref:Uncharacterized protein n=1 Tax=Dictyostelium firmibasis TaxID=79012 RepID=A0AAN7U0B0_9MYCE